MARLLIALLAAWVVLGLLGIVVASVFWLLKFALVLAAVAVAAGWLVRTIRR